MKLRVQVTKTASGDQEYVQVMSDDFLINVVLIADEIEVRDDRPRDDRPVGETP